MNTEDKKNASMFADQMVVETFIAVALAADKDPKIMSKIHKYINAIVDIGKKDGNPEEFYMAILILANGINKADIQVKKDHERLQHS